mmetsp:Transcript_67693/g.134293  ORF Transcript_67693/g.134293 Transcript_67693/m.134293 type:complete len:93 (-) Transcript_67693:45-323(-)
MWSGESTPLSTEASINAKALSRAAACTAAAFALSTANVANLTVMAPARSIRVDSIKLMLSLFHLPSAPRAADMISTVDGCLAGCVTHVSRRV